MPSEIPNVRREHVEAFLEYLLARWTPSTASNRYKSLRVFLRLVCRRGRDSAESDGQEAAAADRRAADTRPLPRRVESATLSIFRAGL
jgi:hypothetical protein